MGNVNSILRPLELQILLTQWPAEIEIWAIEAFIWDKDIARHRALVLCSIYE